MLCSIYTKSQPDMVHTNKPELLATSQFIIMQLMDNILYFSKFFKFSVQTSKYFLQ